MGENFLTFTQVVGAVGCALLSLIWFLAAMSTMEVVNKRETDEIVGVPLSLLFFFLSWVFAYSTKILFVWKG